MPQAERVALLIEGQAIEYWSEIEITDSVDTFSTVSFSAPFDWRREDLRELFRPFSFNRIEVTVNDERLFTGVMVGVAPYLEPGGSYVEISGYSLPGTLADCTSPAAMLDTKPLEFKKLKLRDIAASLCEPFAIEVDFRNSDGTPFDQVAIKVDQKILDFLIELAQHRNLVFSNTADGKLVCWRSVETGNPVARLVEGQPPVTHVEPSFDPQDYYSEITGFAPKKRRHKPSKWTERNPWLRNLRPLSFKMDDLERGDAPEAARAKLARMFGQMASYTVPDIPTWRDPSGELWKPNTTVTLTAPNAMCYTETELLVRSVSRRQTADSLTTALNLVLPGAYSGTLPKTLPWSG